MKVIKPWGSYEIIAELPGAVVKVLIINPGQRLSKQFHKHRREYLIPQSGFGAVDVGITPGPDSPERRHFFTAPVIVPAGHKHRIFCPPHAPQPLVLIEVWQGEVLDEADNIRLEDDYGRD